MVDFITPKPNTYEDNKGHIHRAREDLRMMKQIEQAKELAVLEGRLKKVVTPIQGGYKIQYL